jgi:MoxR-like ATPase
LRERAEALDVGDAIRDYIVELVRHTREAEGVALGAGMRASLSLMKTAQALALLEGAEFVTPEHVQHLAVPVIAHRLSLNSQARFSGLSAESVLETIVRRVPPPI